jgi:hypothetical protein
MPEIQGPAGALRAKIMGMVRPQGWADHAKPVTPDACRGAVEFLDAALRAIPGLPAPEVSPSPRGGVSLSWWLNNTGFLVRVFAERGAVYFQQEGPDFCVETGTAQRGTVLRRLAGLSKPAAMS